MTGPLPPAPAAPRRARRPLVLGLVATLVLGGAGWSIWASAGDDILAAIRQYRLAHAPPPPPPAPVADRPIGDDEPANWTEVALFRAGPSRPRPVLVFRRAGQAPATNGWVHAGLFAREVARQGLIRAAREASDAVVRDRAVGDPDEAGAADATCRLGSIMQPREGNSGGRPLGVRLTLVAGDDAERKVLWHRNLDIMGAFAPEYDRLVAEVERLGRTDFRAVLAAWGLPAAAPTPLVAPEELPDATEARLGSLVEAEQFAALRRLHEAARRWGPSPARSMALARGYAMLGSLTEPLLSGDQAAFQARSVLYAQAAAVADRDSPRSLRNRAFVEALAGMNAAARASLARADQVDRGKGTSPLVETTRAYLDTDPEALGRIVARRPDDLLPLYLRAVARARISGQTDQKGRIAAHEVIADQEAVLARVPDCHRAILAMCDCGGVSNLHRATTVGLEPFAVASARLVAALPGLPPAVARLVDDGAAVDEVALRRSLDAAAAADDNDLSWGVLAQVLRETRFVQVARRANFLAFWLNAGSAQFVEEARAMIADHPSRDYIEFYSGRLDQAHASHALQRLDLADVQLKDLYPLAILNRFDPRTYVEIWKRALFQTDQLLVPNHERLARLKADEPKGADWATELLDVDPTSPVARTVLVKSHWGMYRTKAAGWAQEQPWNTPLVAEIGHQYLKAKNYDEARPRLEAALARSPEPWIFLGLAEIYREQGRVDRWVAAAEEFVRQPDQGLDHAAISDNLARYLMKHGEFDRAWPWAERGAQSGAAWTMKTASECAEMRRDFPNAEAWIARTAQRYPGDWLEWVGWCLRTGRGHLDLASRLVWAQYDAGRPVTSANERFLLEHLGLILDRPDVTRALAEAQLAEDPAATVELAILAQACDRLGDAKARDEATDRLVLEPKPTAPKTAASLVTLVEWHRHREDAPLAAALARVDAILAEIPAANRMPTDALVAQFLILLGQPDEALPYLKRADVPGSGWALRSLARKALKERGEPLADVLIEAPTPAPPPPRADESKSSG